MKIVLFQPEIPQNTGNIIRTCSVTGTELILVRPLGFSTDSKHLKRAGLDYFEHVPVTYVDDFAGFLAKQPHQNLVFFSSKATRRFSDTTYHEESLLIFGAETKGLPQWTYENYKDRFVTLPMLPGKRCLNLATSAGIGLYHALHQLDFAPLNTPSTV